MKIKEIFESQPQFPPILRGAREIADYCHTWAIDDMSDDMMLEYFRDCNAVLKLVPINTLQEGPPDSNISKPSKEAKYIKMNPKTMPPIIVSNGVVIDGHHRFRVAKKLGLKEIWIYDVQY